MIFLAYLTAGLATLGGLTCLGSTLFVAAPPTLLMLAGALLVGLPLINLRLALSLFILALPLFGNRPGSQPADYLLFLSCALQLGLMLALARPSNRSLLKSLPRDNTIFFYAYLFLLTALLSLSGLPLEEYLHDLRACVPSWHDWSAMTYRIFSLASATEEKIDYSILSVLWLSLALNIALAVYLTAQNNMRQTLHYAAMLLAGLVASLVVGLLDYYQLLDLRFWRALDPTANPGDVQFRLQSFFGHSGWFAEYVTLCIPYSMLLLLLPVRFLHRVGLLLLLLLVGEFTLILTFQRGGWLSYPLTLCAVWAAIYICYQLERQRTGFLPALKSSLTKVALSLPLTLVISTLILFALNHYRLFPAGNQFEVGRYWERLKEIQRTSDRSDFVRAGFLLAQLNPFLGGGAESFAVHYEREFASPAGRYYQSIVLPLHGSAHNVYLQIFAGQGLAGLALLLLLVAGMIYRALKIALYDEKVAFPGKVMLLIGAACGAAFLIYGNVQEVFYTHALQCLFFITLALTAAAAPSGLALAGPVRRRVWLILAVFIGLDWTWKLLQLPFVSPPKFPWMAYGCYAAEKDSAGGSFSWCGVRAKQLFRAAEEPKTARVHLRFGPNRSPTQPATLQFWWNNEKVYEVPVNPGEEYQLRVPLPQAEKQGSQLVWLELKTASYFIPRRDMPPSGDTRLLSYQLYKESP